MENEIGWISNTMIDRNQTHSGLRKLEGSTALSNMAFGRLEMNTLGLNHAASLMWLW